MTEPHAGPGGEPQETAAPSPEGEPTPHGFGDEAAEMANETEVEAGRSDEVENSEGLLGEDVEGDLVRTRRDVSELTSDIQRLQAEFVNYKRRVERDRDLVKENATYAALAPIIEVLDTIDRAREHGVLEDGLKTVADQLERAVTRVGLEKFGEPGETFDPTVHEALSHLGEDPEVTVVTCKVVAKSGYRVGQRVVRPAQVLVVDPVAPAVDTEPDSAE